MRTQADVEWYKYEKLYCIFGSHLWAGVGLLSSNIHMKSKCKSYKNLMLCRVKYE